MNRIVRELKSISGAVLMLTVLLIAVFFVWNQLSTRNLGPLSTGAGWIASHANGTAYSGVASTASTAPASVSYLGPMN
jgi:hypothetical protein